MTTTEPQPASKQESFGVEIPFFEPLNVIHLEKFNIRLPLPSFQSFDSTSIQQQQQQQRLMC